MTFRLRRIGLISSAKFGFVAGAVTAAPIGIVIAFLIRVVIGWLRHLLEGWQHASVDVGALGKVPVDMVHLLNLGNVLTTVQKLDRLPLIVVASAFVCVVVIAGLISAVGTSWQAFSYNSTAALSGGLEVELEPESGGQVVVLRKNPNRP